MRNLYPIFLVMFFPLLAGAQGVIVNEMSNGPAGSQEYFELVVIPNGAAPCDPVDLRGFIFDDNNGDFSPGGPGSSRGIASGHVAFDNNLTFSAFPPGSIIVLYNDGDPNPSVPANDPTDANADGVYVIPVSLLTTTGCGSNPSTTSASYLPCTGGYGAASWNSIGLRNTGDAGQVRTPTGAYFHGIAYGSAANNMDGGPDGLMVDPTSGSGECFYFTNSVDNDFRNVANFAQGVAPTDETPGLANSPANSAWISSLVCPLASGFTEFTAVRDNENIQLTWLAENESSDNHYYVERSLKSGSFNEIGSVAAGNKRSDGKYHFEDPANQSGYVYYRIRREDADGRISYSSTVMVRIEHDGASLQAVFPNPVKDKVHFVVETEDDFIISIYDISGKLMKKGDFATGSVATIVVNDMPAGMYLYRISTGKELITGKLIVE